MALPGRASEAGEFCSFTGRGGGPADNQIHAQINHNALPNTTSQQRNLVYSIFSAISRAIEIFNINFCFRRNMFQNEALNGIKPQQLCNFDLFLVYWKIQYKLQ